jgi:hypothetical protein
MSERTASRPVPIRIGSFMEFSLQIASDGLTRINNLGASAPWLEGGDVPSYDGEYTHMAGCAGERRCAGHPSVGMELIGAMVNLLQGNLAFKMVCSHPAHAQSFCRSCTD